MRSLQLSLFVGALALVGCSRESAPGGPGAKVTTPSTTTTTRTPDGGTKTTTTTTEESESRDRTFTVKVPSGGTNVTQGKREEVTISLSRGNSFKQAVHLKFEAPKGLKVVPAEATIKGGDSKTNVFVEAAADAPVGRQMIVVTGNPETGKAATVNMDIDVKKKS